MLANQAAGKKAAQNEIYLRLIERLKAAGADVAAITSVAGHFPVEELKPLSPLPLVDIIEVTASYLVEERLTKIGILGTRVVMQTGFYGGLGGIETVAPAGDLLDQVHQSYVDMAVSGSVTASQVAVFTKAGRDMTEGMGADAVLLGGTDLVLAFDGADPGFRTIDCAGLHVAALAAMVNKGST